MNNDKAYLITALSLCATLCAAVAAFCALVDPYGLYRFVEVAGFNANKPGHRGHDRMVKASAVRAIRPDVVLLGTSRTQYGMDAQSLELMAVGRRPYNLGLVGSGPYLALRYLQHAQANGPLKMAILGLDPLMFDLSSNEMAADFNEARLDAAPDGSLRRVNHFADACSTLFSWDALRLSVRTVVHQDTLISELQSLGSKDERVLQQHLAQSGGVHQHFVDTERDYLKTFRAFRLTQDYRTSPKFAALTELLRFARAHNIELRLYISPVHARMNEVIVAAGKQREVEQWKRQLVAALVDHNAANPWREPVRLWDFSYANQLTTEEVPSDKQAHAPMRYYWETSHFRQALGDIVLQKILSQHPAAQSFGMLLDSPTLNNSLASMHRAQLRWEHSHAADVREIADLAAPVLSRTALDQAVARRAKAPACSG